MWIYCKHQQCKSIHKAWLCSTALVPSLPSDTVITKNSDFLCCNRTKNSTRKADSAALSALQTDDKMPVSPNNLWSLQGLSTTAAYSAAGYTGRSPIVPGATLRRCLMSNRESLRVFLGSPGIVGSPGITGERKCLKYKDQIIETVIFGWVRKAMEIRH